MWGLLPGAISMSPELQAILQPCDRLSANEQLALIQVLAAKLQRSVAQLPAAATGDRAATEPAPYQPQNAKDYINHRR
jgi:hypothetical protein